MLSHRGMHTGFWILVDTVKLFSNLLVSPYTPTEVGQTPIAIVLMLGVSDTLIFANFMV